VFALLSAPFVAVAEFLWPSAQCIVPLNGFLGSSASDRGDLFWSMLMLSRRPGLWGTYWFVVYGRTASALSRQALCGAAPSLLALARQLSADTRGMNTGNQLRSLGASSVERYSTDLLWDTTLFAFSLAVSCRLWPAAVAEVGAVLIVAG
jgi:hypothetical protein